MKQTHQPMRWAEPGSDAPGEVAAAIRTLRARRGSTEQVEALGRRLAPQLAAPPVVDAGAAVSPWLKVGGVVLLSGAIVFFALTRMTGMEAPHTQPRAQPAQPQQPMQVESPLPPSPATPALAPAPQPPEPRPKSRAASKPRPARAASPGELAPPPSPERELVLLQRSQSALDRDPGAALALAEEHARDYPQGVFAQEREILAIEALLKLRQRPAALARADRFLQRHPESPHSTRVRALLERSASLGPATIDDGTAHPEDVPVPEGGGP
jgi:hypothetical protein